MIKKNYSEPGIEGPCSEIVQQPPWSTYKRNIFILQNQEETKGVFSY